VPVFAHLPLLVDAKGGGLSKRTGALSIADLRPGMLLEGQVTNVAAFGAFVGVILITLLSTWAAGFALRFGSPEYFAVYFLAFASFVGLGGAAPFKTLVSMGLGLAIAQPTRRVIVCNGDGSMLMTAMSIAFTLFFVVLTRLGPSRTAIATASSFEWAWSLPRRFCTRTRATSVTASVSSICDTYLRKSASDG